MNSAVVTDGEGFGIDSLWESFRLTVIGLIRTAPFWLLAGILGMLAVSRIAGNDGSDASATAQLGLTDQVVWPFYDVVLSETEGAAVASEQVVSDLLGSSLLSYTVTQPEGLGIVEITVTAPTEDEAQRGADAAAQAVVEANLGSVTADLDDRLQALSEVERVAGSELDDVAAEIQAATAKFFPGMDESVRRGVDQEIQILQRTRDEAQRRQLAARSDVEETALEISLAKSEVTLTYVATEGPTETSNGILPVAAGVGLALAAAIALNVYVREYGRIQTPAQVRTVAGLPTVSFPDTPIDAVPLARLLHSMRESGTRVVGIASIPSGADSAHLMSVALKEVGEEVRVAEFSLASESHDALTFTVLDPNDETTIDAQLACDAALVVIRHQKTSLRGLRNRVRSLEARGLPVRGVVLRHMD